MSIRKRTNHRAEQAKTMKALEKAGMSGLIISEYNGEIQVHLFGSKHKAYIAIQTAMSQVDYLQAAAQFVTGPKMTVLGQEPVHNAEPFTEREQAENVNEDAPTTIEQAEFTNNNG